MTDLLDYGLALDPIAPVAFIAIFGVLGIGLTAFGAVRRVRGSLVRTAAVAAFTLALLGPALQREIREPLSGVVALVVDRTQSQRTAGRVEDTDAIAADLTERLEALPNVELRTVEVSRPDPERDGTTVFAPLADALSDVPPGRIAGAIIVTDGQVHDIPAEPPINAPIHAIIPGTAGERDRRVEIVAAPRFGLVGNRETVIIRIDDPDAEGERVPLTIAMDGAETAVLDVTIGETITLAAPISHGGDNFFQFVVDEVPGELTTTNNTAVAVIEGVRENLRVLLVSGEPHAGERTWRNLLKSDAAVDLVHFTILRPPEKQDGTPIHELSLIAFPTRELFSQKIDEFDLIVFDRYQRRNVLPSLYFDNIAQYIIGGGALLIAAGPDYAGNRSVYHTPLAAALPTAPSGSVIEAPYKPQITDLGERHPVTRDLPGNAEDPDWSRWFRHIEGVPITGYTLMSGAGENPLLVLSREGDGRVAMLMSDHIWLWARSFEGGGPHLPLMRNLSHWLMQEPELEEEALRLETDNATLVIERQTLATTTEPVTLTRPDGTEDVITLEEQAPGLYRAIIDDPEMGLYRADDGTLTALGHLGPVNPLEARDLRATTERLAPITEASRGAARQVDSAPRVLLRPEGRSMAGSDWIGLQRSSASELVGVERVPLFAGFAGLAILLAALSLTWYREGR
ncbi:MAG: hypothetical protein AAF580_11405 [Pseudomonadota bacterium]